MMPLDAPFALRPVTTDDLSLTFEIKREAIGEFVAQIWGWDEAFQWQFHRETFEAYLPQTHPSKFWVVEVAGQPVGTWEVAEHTEALFVCGIYLRRAAQGRGIGRKLIENLLVLAQKQGKKVTLEVFKINFRAFRFYQKLGFLVTSETETKYVMSAQPVAT
jgi:ribosomal protein S18 acetylase RimI-like enzyme